MADQDRDIATLDTLLGQTRPAYRALQHRGTLPEAPQARARVVPFRKVAIAACLTLAVGTLTWTALTPDLTPNQPRPFRTALPDPVTSPLTLRPRPAASAQIAQIRTQRPLALKLPKRPTRTEG